MYIQGYDGGAPTRALTAALNRLAPELFAAGDRNRADLTIVPRRDEDRSAAGWYDVYYSHPSVEVIEHPLDGTHPATTQALIRIAAAIPPPPLIPADERIAAAAPVSLDGLSEEHIRLYGGADEVHTMLTQQRDVAIRDDHSVDAYDWDALAVHVVDLVRELKPPKLNPGQRAHVAAARLLEALERVPAERASLAAHLRNAEQAGQQLAELRGILAAIDPTQVQEDAQ
ncbi:hypothetical protein ABT297_03980 [Dactylosporangium sp. NPDC000555]|uniref:hypothetical protein n=1 Tax=Dactylosporangium sp. NPDC000555 TaxID=3154260 RepID=UPI003316D67F